MHELIHQILNDPLGSLLIILNLVIIESLLSVDNAAVLSTMVMKLPIHQQKKALKYGIVGAYIFRGICLFGASFLVKVWWLKGVGGLYLIYLAVSWWLNRNKPDTGEEEEKTSWLYKATMGRLGKFWATVVSVEIMDLAFSIDNVFAAVAFSKNIIIILIGVFIGILAMRYVAQGFTKLMHRYPFLESSAYLVILLLGIKLNLSMAGRFFPGSKFVEVTESSAADWVTSGLTLAIFFVPMLTSRLFNIPKHEG